MEPIALSDDELGAVLAAARPIPVDRRDSFLKAVTDALAGQSPIGPGTVHRAIVEAQRRHWDPPDLSHHSGKYR